MTKSVFSDRYEQFCQSLKQARRKAGITQVELSDRLHKPQSYVSKFEQGERRLDVIEFIDVATAIGIDPRNFLAEVIQTSVKPDSRVEGRKVRRRG